MMKHFYLITNRPKDPDFTVTCSIADYLNAHGCRYTLSAEKKVPEEIVKGYTDPAQIPEDVDCVLVLGGDGTVIRAARDIVDRQIPILGINLGTLGYLTEVDRSSVFPALDCLLAGEYQIERRMMLQGKVLRNGEKIASDIALNDIVIGREGPMRVISLHNYVNDAYLNSYRADGIILATPTGSTGYSLSAGGPLISPGAALFLMTPLAAHTLNTRSIVLPPENVITVQIGEGRDGRTEHAVACFDGGISVQMQTGDRIEISRADKDTRIVKLHHDSFLEILRRKLH